MGDTCSDIRLLALPADDGRFVFCRDNARRLPEHRERRVLKLNADFLRDDLAADYRRDIGEHFLLTVAVARRLHREHTEGSAKLVHDKGGERIALDILGNNHKFLLPRLHDFFQQGQNFLYIADFFISEKDERILHFGLHSLRIRDHIGGDVALVNLESLHDVVGKLHPLRFFNRNHAAAANLLHRLGDDASEHLGL